jgi:hypothetical protein
MVVSISSFPVQVAVGISEVGTELINPALALHERGHL